MKYGDGAFVRPKYSEKKKTLSLPLYPPHVPWTGLGVDTVLHDKGPAPNRLNHVEAPRV